VNCLLGRQHKMKHLITLLCLVFITSCNAPSEQLSQAMEKARKISPISKKEAVRQRDLSMLRWQSMAETAHNSGDLDGAELAYRNLLAIDSANSRAIYGMEQLAIERRHRAIITAAAKQLKQGDTATAQRTLQPVLIENPKHRQALSLQRQIEEQQLKNNYRPTLNDNARKPISLEFRDASLHTIFEMISQLSDINFILDKEVRPDLKASILMKDSTIEDAVKMLLLSNHLEQKIINSNTVLIYPNTPERNSDNQELVVKSFYLGNADVKQTLNMIATIIKSKDIYLDERLNLLVVRDTPDRIAIAEKLIASQDLAEPEVMLEMEVLEVSTNRLTELGIRYPDQLSAGVVGNIASGVTGGAVGGVLSLNQLHNINDDMVRVTLPDPTLLLKLSKTDTDSNLLANPRIRVKNREKAKIHIGERVPVITTTSSVNIGIAESVNYLEVGLKLSVEPDIHIEDDVSIKVELEVSNIIDTITTSSGSKTYRLGTRTAQTTLRLKNGETQVLAGLIQDMDRTSAQKVPLLGDIPLLGRLFSSHGSDKNKTEIMLLITPHIVRNLERPAVGVTEFMSGTSASGSVSSSGFAQTSSTYTSPVHASRNETLTDTTTGDDNAAITPVSIPVPMETTDSSTNTAPQTQPLLPYQAPVLPHVQQEQNINPVMSEESY